MSVVLYVEFILSLFVPNIPNDSFFCCVAKTGLSACCISYVSLLILLCKFTFGQRLRRAVFRKFKLCWILSYLFPSYPRFDNYVTYIHSINGSCHTRSCLRAYADND